MMLVTRGLGSTNLPTAGLGVSLGNLFNQSLVGSLSISGIVATTFIEGVELTPTNAYGRRFFGTFFGPTGQQHR